jgi:hypothetical protein
MAVANSLSYYDMTRITAVKSLIVQAINNFTNILSVVASAHRMFEPFLSQNSWHQAFEIWHFGISAFWHFGISAFRQLAFGI